MNAEIIKTFRFEAAHSLDKAPAGHKCRRLHGHSYRVDVHVSGLVDPDSGWVMDFGDVAKAVEPILRELDHHNLNEVPGLENSTSELLARYLWGRLAPALPGLSAIAVWESEMSRCVYRGA
jgi:6-pyruvoyltetrahydropterin/6-carboxytetrahydropterin synthase